MYSGLPPSRMSVPRPAMLVEMVTPRSRPDCATGMRPLTQTVPPRTYIAVLFVVAHRQSEKPGIREQEEKPLSTTDSNLPTDWWMGFIVE